MPGKHHHEPHSFSAPLRDVQGQPSRANCYCVRVVSPSCLPEGGVPLLAGRFLGLSYHLGKTSKYLYMDPKMGHQEG